MKTIARELARATKLLIPTNKLRAQLFLLVLIAAAIPVSELLVAKLFADLVIEGAKRSLTENLISISLFAGLFVTTRVANYLQKTYRVKFFDKSFDADDRERTLSKESWEWALALEMVNVLTFFTQLAVIVIFFFALSPWFALGNLVLIALVIQIMGVQFKKQLKTQAEFVEKRRNKEKVKPADRLGSRIQSAEFATLLSSVAVVLMLAVLVVMSIESVVSIANAIVLFLGMRLQNTTFASLSSGLMRFARARANSV